MDASQLIGQASAAHASGRLGECRRLSEQASQIDPRNPQALLLLGVADFKLGNASAAIEPLRQVRDLDPTSSQAPFWLSMAYRKLGLRLDALREAKDASRMKSVDAQFLTQLGLCHLDVRSLAEAEKTFREALALSPQVPQIKFSLAKCLRMQGRTIEAEEILNKAFSDVPARFEPLFESAKFLLSQQDPISAVAFCRRALHLKPDSWDAVLVLSRALVEAGEFDEAEISLKVALQSSPNDGELNSLLGVVLQARGDLLESSECFKQSIESQPTNGFGYFSLVSNRTVVETDREFLLRMQALLSDSELGLKNQSYLHYGLGKAHADLGEFEPSIGHFDEANKIELTLKYQGVPFDAHGYAHSIDNVIGAFSSDFLAPFLNADSGSDMPIFVVGMMRSGTTLVEQILTSHPEIGGAGELPFWVDNWRDTMDSAATRIDSNQLSTISSRYLELLQSISPKTARVVDKMPANRAGLGILRAAFPGAKIIHVRRNPVDTCLSIWVTPNRAPVEFLHDRANIVFAYRQYLRLMEHWRSTLAPDGYLEVDYEDFTAEPEHWTRRLIEFCGLEWNDRCLSPQDNRRRVVTPSVSQVRNPIYRTSVERWRKYEPWLGEFSELLS